MVVKLRLEPAVDLLFHPDSYGYRPGKSALDAVGQARQRCWSPFGGPLATSALGDFASFFRAGAIRPPAR